jgi:hypothetical protein
MEVFDSLYLKKKNLSTGRNGGNFKAKSAKYTLKLHFLVKKRDLFNTFFLYYLKKN